MGRCRRVEFPGAIYHVTTRSNAREPIYLDTRDYRAFMRLLGRTCDEFSIECWAYCVLTTHYHLLVCTPLANLSAAMRHLNGSYAQRFNTRYDRIGHVFQGPYRAVLFERDAHLLEAFRYLALNPVRAGACMEPALYRWSSYAATAGLELPACWLRTEKVLELFAAERDRAQRAYTSFVTEGLLGTRSADMAAPDKAPDLVRR